MRFSDRYVDSLKPRDKRFAVFEDNARGRGTLGLRVTPKGVKTWVHFYKLDGRKRMTTLGRYPEMTVAEAHAIFGQAGLAVARGQDPAHVAKTERIRRRGALNVADLAEVYLERWARPRKRSWREDERILRHDVLPALGQMKSEDVERRHIVEILDAIVERGAPIVANRTLAVVRKMYGFGIERELVVRNPCEGVSPPAPERRRQRVLGDDELRVLLAALPATTMWTPTQLAMLFLLTTAQRCTEVVTMRWSQVDQASGWWTIPAERAKNGMAHRVPLSAQSAQILELARRHHLGGDAVFPSRRDGGPMVATAVARGVARNREAVGIEHFTPHDLRRTAASQMTSLGIGRLVVSKVLNHAERGVTAVYDRHSYDGEKVEAMERWGVKLTELGIEQTLAAIETTVRWRLESPWWSRRRLRLEIR